MKTKILLCVLVSLAGVAVPALGQDSERIAEGFVRADIGEYTGSFGFTRVLPEGSSQFVEGQFTMWTDGRLPYLVIDGVEVVAWGDEPLGGLPVNKIGSATGFWMNLNAWDGTTGRYCAHGSAYDELLLPSDTISVELTLAYREQFVPFDVSNSGVDSTNLILRIGGSWFSYDSQRGGFSFWFDPGVGGSYDIIDQSTGRVLARGDIDNGLAESNVVNIRMSGGVRELIPTDQSSAYWREQWPACYIERDGQWWSAQVYITRTWGQSLSLEASGLQPGSRLEVYSVDGDERVLVAETDVLVLPTTWPIGKSGREEGFLRLQTPIGYDRLIVEVIGQPVDGSGFDLWTYRSGGGGKG